MTNNYITQMIWDLFYSQISKHFPNINALKLRLSPVSKKVFIPILQTNESVSI